MIAFAIIAAAALADFAWVTARVRREWSRSDDLSRASAIAISSLYVLAAALFGLALALRPWPIGLPLAVALPLGGAFIVAGGALAAVAIGLFGSPEKLYGVETGELVDRGVYRVTRNPQYGGLILAGFGIGIVGRSGLALTLAAFLAAALWLWVAAVEEPHLEGTFGERYRRYAAAVPRFFSLSRRASR